MSNMKRMAFDIMAMIQQGRKNKDIVESIMASYQLTDSAWVEEQVIEVRSDPATWTGVPHKLEKVQRKKGKIVE